MEKTQSETGSQFEFQSFGKDVLIYSLGNVFLLFASFVQVFIIARYLSVEGYGYWQLFLLYSNFAGLLSLGFLNGFLVRWAGKTLAEVGIEVKQGLIFLILEQVVIIVPLGLLLYYLLRFPLQWICLMTLAFAFIHHLVFFFMFTLQAIRKFTFLTAVNVGRGTIFLIAIIILVTLGYADFTYIGYAFLGTLMLIFFGLAFYFRQYLQDRPPVFRQLWAYGKKNINIGIFIMLGDYIFELFLAIDRFVVSSFFTIDQFAIYSFALGVAVVIYSLIKAVSEVFFPYLSSTGSQMRTQVYRLGKTAIILTWAAVLAVYFPLARLVEFYLPHYVASLSIMQILLCTVGFGGLIQVLHINYYKVYRRQRQYFMWGIVVLAFSVLLIFSALKFWGTLESIAIATFSGFGIWYIVNEFILKSVIGRNSSEIGKDTMIIILYLGAFWIATLLIDWFVAQILIYICLFLPITWLFFRHEVKQLAAIANQIRTQRR